MFFCNKGVFFDLSRVFVCKMASLFCDLFDVYQLCSFLFGLKLHLNRANSVLINGKPIFGRVIFAHGAGAPMDHEFMNNMSLLLAEQGLEVHRFEFPYMHERRINGKKRPPDRIPRLIECYEQVICSMPDTSPVYLAGKSMGGRVATMVLEESIAQSAFVFGYPFHPTGKPDRLRTEHLEEISKPVHIFQGSRDAMGSEEEVRGYNLSSKIDVHWLHDANHDLKPRKASGFSQQEYLNYCAQTVGELIR